MTVPKISPLPTPPNRTDAPAQFVARADAFLGALPTLRDEANTQSEFTNARAMEAADSAQSAASSKNAAQQAATQAGLNGAAQVNLARQEVQKAADEVGKAAEQVALAKGEVALAKGYAEDAEQSHMDAMTAAAAAASGAGMPSLIGNRGKTLLVNETETGVTWGDALKLSTQAQATQGTDNTTAMTPLRVKQVIDATAMAAMFGYGQAWQMVTRLHNVSYQNTTGKPIMVSVSARGSGTEAGASIQVSTDNATWRTIATNSSHYDSVYVDSIIPDGNFYRLIASWGGSIVSVMELR